MKWSGRTSLTCPGSPTTAPTVWPLLLVSLPVNQLLLDYAQALPLTRTAKIRFSAVQSPRFWVSGFHSSYLRLLNLSQETQYLTYAFVATCWRMKLAISFRLSQVTRPWRRTLTNGSDVKYVFPRCPPTPNPTSSTPPPPPPSLLPLQCDLSWACSLAQISSKYQPEPDLCSV